MHKQNIAELYSIYKPRKKKKQAPKNIKTMLTKKENPSNLSMSRLSVKISLSPNDSFQRSHSVFKGRDDMQAIRFETKSVEPLILPPIREKSLEPISKKADNSLLSASPTYDEGFQRLEFLVNRNHSARNNLLSVQQRIMDLGVSNLIKSKKFQSTHQGIENLSFEEIDESLKERGLSNILKTISEEKDIFPSKYGLKLPPL
ncbi:unnamed protein product [Blepharisma stoltei]|uniref:Uncharacterized protein n=1 Tax=Blepharisma stoltei TaxID=1481888 RepID=A0AAU9JG73_9CILI|nr:unnamed protein product [Blepharisma stoltei]